MYRIPRADARCARWTRTPPGPLREAFVARSRVMLPKNILVPTDLSEGAEAALDYACELASKLDATIHLLNVIGIPALGLPELGVALTSTVIDSMIVDNQRALEELAARKCGHAKMG